MKTRVAGLWIATALLEFGIGSGEGRNPRISGTTGRASCISGSPAHSVTIIIGFSKVLGAAALPAPGFPRRRDGSNGPMRAFS
jgi:hypothetical protein